MNAITKLLMLFITLTPAISAVGCGNSDGVTVITPGEDYQLTPQEQENKEAEMKARQSGGD